MSLSYVLITTAKNEEKKLPLMAESISEQSIKPKLWLIINDNSNDKTPKILNKLKLNYDWIHSLDLNESTQYDLGKHFSILLNIAFENIIQICDKQKIDYNYIGKIDADIILPKNLFEALMIRMKKDSDIGLAGPELDIINEEDIKSFDGFMDNHLITKNDSLLEDPSDAIRLYKKDCFFDSWNFKVTYAPDMVSTARAKIFGWKTKRFKDLRAYHYGKTCDTGGLWNGLKFSGFENYYLGISILIILFQSIRILLRNKDFNAIALLYGFFNSYIQKADQIDDFEILYYFKNKYPKEIRKALIDRIR